MYIALLLSVIILISPLIFLNFVMYAIAYSSAVRFESQFGTLKALFTLLFLPKKTPVYARFSFRSSDPSVKMSFTSLSLLKVSHLITSILITFFSIFSLFVINIFRSLSVFRKTLRLSLLDLFQKCLLKSYFINTIYI